jgi:hypothetical protein
MGTGTIVGVTKVVDNGPDSSQWNLVIVGDGYTAAEQGTFTSTVDSFLAILQTTPPFSGSLTWDRINVHRLDVHSDQSGAINPATCPDGTTPFGSSASTGVSFFDAEYCAAPEDLRRLLQVDTGAVSLEVGLLVPEVDAILVLVNHVEPGGSGAPGVAVSYGGGIYDGTAIHELGHSAFGLGDEYDFWEGCASGETGQDTFTGAEPIEPNLTIDADRNTIKWAQYIDPLTPMPTTVNPYPAACDVQGSPVAPGEVGAFDGAFYHHSGVYRPAYECMMRDKSFAEFCGVCAGVIAGGIVVEGSTCYIVTAVYGDPFATDVVTLREWRDRYLRRAGISGLAMRLLNAGYVRVGPWLGRQTERRPAIARVLRRWVFAPWARRLRVTARQAAEVR